MASRINVTKTFLPPKEEFGELLDGIWESGQLTNQGPLLSRLENKLETYLNVDKLHFVTNGTVALQLAIKSLGVDGGEIITTPFSYVASTSAILWEDTTPVFVDIKKDTFCIDPSKIEAAITSKTKAILAVHVFGNPCDIEAIEGIAKKHNLKTIYDGAHAFGVSYKGKSLLGYGDVSTCSFHSTKIFHTIEGGAVIARDKKVSDKIELMKRFGHNQDDHIMVGINAKASEFSAAMGLCNLKYIDGIIEDRKATIKKYRSELGIDRPIYADIDANGAYFPVLCSTEDELNLLVKELKKHDIYPRRYFYPSLNKLPYLKSYIACPVSEDIASRILCLPLWFGMNELEIDRVVSIVGRFQVV